MKKDKEKSFAHVFMYKVWWDSLFVGQYAHVLTVIAFSILM